MIRTGPGVCPRHTSPQFSRHRGFSVIELIMSVMLVAIGVALAIPSYRDQVEKRQITNGAEQLASFVNTAQGVAMKTNQIVTISYSRNDGDDWCVGAVTGATPCVCTVTDDTADDFCQIASQPFILNNSHAGDRDIMHAINGDGSFAVDPIRGLLDDSVSFELRSNTEKFRLNLLVNNTGRVMLCSDDADHAIPGYEACP